MACYKQLRPSWQTLVWLPWDGVALHLAPCSGGGGEGSRCWPPTANRQPPVCTALQRRRGSQPPPCTAGGARPRTPTFVIPTLDCTTGALHTELSCQPPPLPPSFPPPTPPSGHAQARLRAQTKTLQASQCDARATQKQTGLPLVVWRRKRATQVWWRAAPWKHFHPTPFFRCAHPCRNALQRSPQPQRHQPTHHEVDHAAALADRVRLDAGRVEDSVRDGAAIRIVDAEGAARGGDGGQRQRGQGARASRGPGRA